MESVQVDDMMLPSDARDEKVMNLPRLPVVTVDRAIGPSISFKLAGVRHPYIVNRYTNYITFTSLRLGHTFTLFEKLLQYLGFKEVL